MTLTTTRDVITMNRLREAAPSVFAMDKKEGLSNKYQFVPTSEIVSEMEMLGWLPVKAVETRCRNTQNMGFQKHMLRFRNFNENVNEKLVVGDTFIEIVLTNSHDGLSSFIFNCGLYRLACSNGMVISEASFNSIHVRHNSYEAKDVLNVCSGIIERAPLMAGKVNEFKSIILLPQEQAAFGEAAKRLRFDEPENISTSRIMSPRRVSDKGNDLWTTFNVAQENLIKGDVKYYKNDERGRPKSRHTREVKAIDNNMKLNQALWTLTEEMAKIKTNQS